MPASRSHSFVSRLTLGDKGFSKIFVMECHERYHFFFTAPDVPPPPPPPLSWRTSTRFGWVSVQKKKNCLPTSEPSKEFRLRRASKKIFRLWRAFKKISPASLHKIFCLRRGAASLHKLFWTSLHKIFCLRRAFRKSFACASLPKIFCLRRAFKIFENFRLRRASFSLRPDPDLPRFTSLGTSGTRTMR